MKEYIARSWDIINCNLTIELIPDQSLGKVKWIALFKNIRHSGDTKEEALNNLKLLLEQS